MLLSYEGMPMQKLAEALAARQLRERWLLLVLVAVVLPLGYALLVIVPLAQQTQDVHAQTNQAHDLLGWLERQAATFDPDELNSAPTTGFAPPRPADVERSLEQAGLKSNLSKLSVDQDGRMTLSFDFVSFAAAMDWFDQGHPDGLHLSELQIESTETSGLVRLNAVLGMRP